MKLIATVLFLIVFSTEQAKSQQEQEWIHFEQPYVRIPVTSTGWYRITKTELKSFGFEGDSLLPGLFQLFRRGQEVPITITGDTDTTEAIEFYGEKNDGARDSSLYTSPAIMPHPYYSLYSDTAVYFLTWNKVLLTGKRINQSTLAGSDTGVYYHQQQLLQVYTDEYPAGNLYPMGSGYDNGSALSTYDEGEGWTGKTLTTGNQLPLHFHLPNPANATSPIHLNLLLVGRNAGRHRVEIWTDTHHTTTRKLGETEWLNYATSNFETELFPSDLHGDSLTIWIKPLIPLEQISVSYARVDYPQNIRLPLANEQVIFNLATNTSYPFTSHPGLSFFDITDPHNPKQLILSNNSHHHFETTQRLLLVSKPLPLVGLKLIRFQKINPQLTDYLIISHASVRKPEATSDPVEQYARYRSSSAGGSFKPFVINSDVIFDQFNYGEPGPRGISNLIKWLSTNGNLRFVFLIGTSRDPQGVRKLPNARQLDPIPSAGWPGSDIALAMPPTFTHQPVPLVPIGRLFAFSPSDVSNYLEKVRQHESQSSSAGWRKKIIHISGGRSVSELNFFRDFIDQLKAKVDSTYLGVTVASLSKQTDLPIESLPIAPLVNEGASLITVLGHSGLGITDVDLGKASNPDYGYQNETKYPALIVNGCAIGNYFYGPITTSTDWITAQKKGGILFLSHTHNGLSNSMKRYTATLYDVLTDPQFTTKAFGTIQQESIRRFLGDSYVITDLITAQQMNLQGDPAIQLFPAQFPDYSWQNNTFTITDENEHYPRTGNKKLTIRTVLSNSGRYFKDSLSILLTRTKVNGTIEKFNFTYPAPLYATEFTETLPIVLNEVGKETWQLNIDPQHTTPEETTTNNIADREIYLQADRVLPLIPVSGATISKTPVDLVAQLPNYAPNQRVIFQWSKHSDFTGAAIDTVISTGIVAFKTLSLFPDDTTLYHWRVALPGEKFSSPSEFRFLPNTPSEELPEGIAFNTVHSSNGETIIPQFYFQNITNTPFSDSLEVVLTTYSNSELREQKMKIPAINAKQTYSFPMPESLSQTPGNYRITANFNNRQLPELSYNNNTTETTFQNIPDYIPPTLDVTVDDRRLTFNEAIGKESLIEVRLSDENSRQKVSDTSLVTIGLKYTDYDKKLPLKKWEFKEPNTLLAYAHLPNNIQPGVYNLVVTGKDKSGNAAAPYTIQFRISETEPDIKTNVYPNPAREWVHFEVSLEGLPTPKQCNITLFNTMGQLIKTLSLALHTGKNNFYWFPANLASGSYYYRIEFTNQPTTRQGKIIWEP